MYNPPQKLKFKKLHKIKRNHFSYERRSNLLKFGAVGIQATEHGKLNACQIEALRIFFRRAFSKPAEIKINVFPGMSLTKKPVSARMGKGKGKPNSWVGHVFNGKILFEITQLKTVAWSPQVAYVMEQALYKLPIKARVIFLKY